MQKHEPKFGRVLIKRELKTKTAGGVYLPDSAAKRHAACEGEIVALGETAGFTESYHLDSATDVYEPITIQTLKVGDRVLFGRHAGAWLDGTEEKDDGTLYICQDSDILTVIREAA